MWVSVWPLFCSQTIKARHSIAYSYELLRGETQRPKMVDVLFRM